MPDQRIFRLKLAIENDGQLSHGAARLGLRVCSHVFNNWRTITPDEPFPLPWTIGSQLSFGMCKKQVYRCMRELVERGHLIFSGNRGVPQTSLFKLNLNSFRVDKNDHSEGVKKVSSRVDNCDHSRGVKKVSPHKYTFPSEEIVSPMEENSGLRPTGDEGGSNGSLRSKGTRGKERAASPQIDDLRTKGLEHIQQFKKSLKGS
jgi:hypothetical protein